MARKEFLKKAGVGSAALASLPALAGAAWADGDDDDDGRRLRFYLVALSGVAATITGGDSLLMAGSMRACKVSLYRSDQHEGRKGVDRLHEVCHVALSLVDLWHTVLSSMTGSPRRRMVG